MKPQDPSEKPRDAVAMRERLREAETAVQKAQRAAYYAHQTFQQCGTPDAAEGYTMALRRCDDAEKALLVVDAEFRSRLDMPA